jgi:site-specific recombinase XerC
VDTLQINLRRSSLTVEQSKKLLHGLPSETVRGKRDQAILALLIGCGLWRAELVGLTRHNFQIREEHWVIADLIGKGRHIRTVPVPEWAKRTVDHWINVADVADGPIFRRVNRLGKVWGDRITKAIWAHRQGGRCESRLPAAGVVLATPALVT